MDTISTIGGRIARNILSCRIPEQRSSIYSIKRNAEKLKDLLPELSASREQVQLKVDEALRKGDIIYIDVKSWLNNVDGIIKEGNEFLEGEAKMDRLHRFCSILFLPIELGMKSRKLVQNAVELYGKREFPAISYNDGGEARIPVIPNPDYEAFDSRISTVKKIMVELRNPNTNRIGVYGLSGVGKTTLIKELLRKAKDQKLFEDLIILFDINRSPELERIQKNIAEQLGLETLENETRYGRARRLCDRMNNKKILVILDGILSGIDLEAVGIPNVATCKVLLTSRNREVFSSYQIRTQRDFQLHVLNGEETWRLLAKTTGDVIKHPTIQPIAMQIARKCGGLPILVITVASYLKDNASLARWVDALRRLMQYGVNDQLTEGGYLGLERSYSQLDMELKSLFLLCGINACGNYISLDSLLKYCMGLGRFTKLSTIKARNSLHSMIEQLKDRCLLLDGNNIDFVKIDDLVLDFAISVAVRDQQMLSKAYGEQLREWPNDDFFGSCTMISLPCCNIPGLPIVLDCPKLRLFHFWSNDGSLEISWRSFEKMKELQVLDLTKLRILSLPSSLQFIPNLHTLCLHGCELKDIALIGQLKSLEILSFARSKVVHLPEEIRHLSCLRVLDLTHCIELVVIFPNVLSSLTRLEDLRMKNSFSQWEAEEGIGERSNACLSELQHLSQLTTLAIHIRDADILPAALFTNKKLDNYQILIGDEWKWEDVDESVNRLLKLKLTASCQLAHQGLQMLLKKSDNLYMDALESLETTVHKSDVEHFQLKYLVVQNYAEIKYIMNEKVLLLNLTSLIVLGCGGLEFLLSSSMTTSLVQLKYLQISKCQMMEEIVRSKEQTHMLLKLEHLELNDLPNLARFCSETHKEIEDGGVLFGKKVRFPRMERLTVNGLPKLTTIWHHQLAPDSFGRLKDIRVQRCDGLITMFVPNILARFNALSTLYIKCCTRLGNIFTASVTKDLQLLQELKVEDCKVLEEIIAKEEGLETSRPKFVFPELKSVTFQNLPQLKSLYPGLHVSKWPLLKTLEMHKCNQVKIFAADVSSYQKPPELSSLPPIKQSFYLIEKDSFPSMKYLTLGAMDIWYGISGLPQFFSKLKSIEICSTTLSKQVVVLRRCGTLPNLRRLRLRGVEELTHQWKKSCLPAGPTLRNLEVLEVTSCGMKNLELSSVSCKTLMILEVTFCWRLEYLMTHSIAKSLVQLTKLKVDECKSMIEIVARDEDGDDAGNYKIVFLRLQQLELCDLTSLQRFCLPSCTVEFPSLENLQVNYCPVEFKLSPDMVLLVGEEDLPSIQPQNQYQTEAINKNSNTEDMHLNLRSDSGSEEAVDAIETFSLETNRNQAGPTASGGAQVLTKFNAGELHNEELISELNNEGPVLPGIAETGNGLKAVIQETDTESSKEMECTEAMDLNQELAFTSSSSVNPQEADLSMQDALIEPSNHVTNEAKQVQLQANSRSQRLSKLDAEIRRLREELRAKEAERDEEQKLA